MSEWFRKAAQCRPDDCNRDQRPSNWDHPEVSTQKVNFIIFYKWFHLRSSGTFWTFRNRFAELNQFLWILYVKQTSRLSCLPLHLISWLNSTCIDNFHCTVLVNLVFNAFMFKVKHFAHRFRPTRSCVLYEWLLWMLIQRVILNKNPRSCSLMVILSVLSVQKLHVQQPGECAVLHHRFWIRLHLLRRRFKGKVWEFTVLVHFLAALNVIAPQNALECFVSCIDVIFTPPLWLPLGF